MNLDAIWEYAVNALMKMRKGGEKVSRADLDSFVHDETKGAITSFAQLAQVRMQHQNIVGQQEKASAGTPSALATGLEGFANGVGLGIPSFLAAHPDGNPDLSDMGDFMAAGAEAHPKTDFVSNAVGGAAVGAIGAAAAMPAAGAAVDALPYVRNLPGLLKTSLASGLSTVPTNTVQAAAGGGSPGQIASQVGLGAALAMPFGAAAGWNAAKYAPAEHLAGRAVQEAATGTPNFKAGAQALLDGTTTPVRVGRPDLGIIHTPLSDAAIAQLPEELRPLPFEGSASLRTLASKGVTQSAEATAQAENAIRNKLESLVTAKQGIEKDLTTGYDALLNDQPITDPEMLALYQQQTGSMKPPTARDVFTLAKKLGNKADRAFLMHKLGTGTADIDLDLAEQQGTQAQGLRQWLGDNVPGFQELQAKVAPYLQRQRELQAAMRSIIGRAIKPLGKTAQAPKGPTMEGLTESFGYSPGQVTEQAARELVPHLFGSRGIQGLLDFVKNGSHGTGGILNASKFRFGAGAVTGGASGAAQSRTKAGQNIRGVLQLLANPNLFSLTN